MIRTCALVSVLATTSSFLSTASFAQNPPTQQQPVASPTVNPTSQRFVLFQGTYSAIVNGKMVNNIQSVFRIDTATGQVWMLIVGVKDNQPIQRWSPINE